jgi:hypothetical protein
MSAQTISQDPVSEAGVISFFGFTSAEWEILKQDEVKNGPQGLGRRQSLQRTYSPTQPSPAVLHPTLQRFGERTLKNGSKVKSVLLGASLTRVGTANTRTTPSGNTVTAFQCGRSETTANAQALKAKSVEKTPSGNVRKRYI